MQVEICNTDASSGKMLGILYSSWGFFCFVFSFAQFQCLSWWSAPAVRTGSISLNRSGTKSRNMCFYVFTAVCFLFFLSFHLCFFTPFLSRRVPTSFNFYFFPSYFFIFCVSFVPHITRNLRTFGARHHASLRLLAFTWPCVYTFILFSQHHRSVLRLPSPPASLQPPPEQTAFTGIFHPVSTGSGKGSSLIIPFCIE